MSRVKKKQHKRPKRSRFQILIIWRALYALRYAAIALFFCITVGYLVWFEKAPQMVQTINETFHALSQKVGFQVQYIAFDGLEKTTEVDILKKINIKKGQSLFKLNLQAARQNIETLPWVHTAMLFRHFPDHLYIRISERHPNALWQKNKKIYLIDEYGKVIEHLSSSDYSHLLLVVGDDAPGQANLLVQELNKFPDISKKTTSAVNHAGRRWDLILKNGVKVKLPENDIHHALVHLAKLDKDHDLTKGDIRVIDIRLKDRSFFYMSPKSKNTKFDSKLGRMT